MKKRWLALPCLLFAALPLLADGAPEQAAVAGANPAHTQLRQQLRARHNEVTRLQHEVAAQESDSSQASQRLEQRDREIDRLQRQLEALEGRRQGGA
jgi:TolA-binding protein